jgi:hypothetical protein
MVLPFLLSKASNSAKTKIHLKNSYLFSGFFPNTVEGGNYCCGLRGHNDVGQLGIGNEFENCSVVKSLGSISSW